MSGLNFYWGPTAPTVNGTAFTLPAQAVVNGYGALSFGEQEQVAFQVMSDPGGGGGAQFNAAAMRVGLAFAAAGVLVGALAGRYLFPKRGR